MALLIKPPELSDRKLRNFPKLFSFITASFAQKAFHVRLVRAHFPPNGRRRFARTGGIVPPPTASAAKRGASAKQQNSAGENRESGAKKF